MKRTIKWLFLLSLAAGVAAYMAYRWRRRGPGPLWEAETSPPFDTPEPRSEPVVVVPSAVDEPLAPEPEPLVATKPAGPVSTAWVPVVAEPPPPPAEPVAIAEPVAEPASTAWAPAADPEPALEPLAVDEPDRAPEPVGETVAAAEPEPVPAMPVAESIAAELEAMVAEESFLERLAPPAEEPAAPPPSWIRDSIRERSAGRTATFEPRATAGPAIEVDPVVEALDAAFEVEPPAVAPPPSDIADEVEAVLEATAAGGDLEPPVVQERPVSTATVEFKPLEAIVEVLPPDDFLPPVIEEALADVQPQPVPATPGRDAESYLDEGNVYFNVGQYGLAIERYTRALELDASLTAGHYNRANARTRAGEYDGALGDYNRALELQPDDSDALNNRGMLHLYRANYDAALRDFNAALAADPSDTTVMVNRGLAHLHGGDAADALVDFQEAAALDDSDAAAHYGAGQAASVLGNREEALKRLRRALQIDPAYAREAAADAKLATLQGDNEFMKLLRETGARR